MPGKPARARVGDNRPQLYWGICAAQMPGGIAVPLYQDGGVNELGFVIDHADADIALAENQEQVDKLLAIRALQGRPSRIVFLDARGLRDDAESGLYSVATLRERGAARCDCQRNGPGGRPRCRGAAIKFRHDRRAQGDHAQP